jgi:fibronectin-binding autotransporter adhesin
MVVLASATPLALTAQKSWDGGANTGNWGDAANWESDGVPGNVALTFNAAVANGQYDINLGVDRVATGLTFLAAPGTNAFTFTGSMLTVGAGGILNQDLETQRFISTVATSAAQTWQAGSGGLQFQHVILNHALTLSGSAAVAVTGDLTLTGNRTLTHDNAGGLQLNQVVLGGDLTITGTGATQVSGTTALNQSRVIANESSGLLTLGQVTMPGSATLTLGGAGDTRVNGGLDGGALRKEDSGTVRLGGASTYTGSTTVTGGTLIVAHHQALGTTAAGTSVTAGGTLALEGGITVTGESLTLRGSGADGAGALRNISGLNTWNGPVTLEGGTTITSVGGTLQIGVNPGPGLPQPQTLALNGHTLTVHTAGGDVRVESNLTGPGSSLVKTGSGTLSLGGISNSHTGTTRIEDGTLRLFTVHEPATSGRNLGLLGPVVIGDGAGEAGSAVLAYGLVGDTFVSGDRIRDNVTLRVNRDGLFDTSGASDIVGAITFQGGDITTRGGVLGITSNITALASDREARIFGAGFLNLGDVTRTIDTASGARLTIESVVTDGGLIKTGGGQLTLSGESTYRGQTEIREGTVTIRSDGALGSTFGSTTISDGAALQVANNLSSAEDITVQGSGPANTGAIRNLSGNNTLSGAITLAGATRINSDAGQLTVTGNVTGAGQNLTVGGAGLTRIDGVIGTGSGTLTKDGTGVLTLAGINTFTGLTTVHDGTLSFANTQVLGVQNVVHTASGAVVDLNGFNQSIGMVTGSGSIIFDGAQLTLNGAGTFGGSFNGAGTLVLAAGSSLTLGADFNNHQLDIVLAGGSLYLNDHASTFRSLTVTGNSVLDFGSGGSIIQFTDGVLANAQLQVKNWVDTIDYFYSSVNAGVQGTPPLNNIVFDGWTGNDTRWLPYTDGPFNDHQITPVPEPRVYGACFMAALVGLMQWHRRRQRRKAGAVAAAAS